MRRLQPVIAMLVALAMAVFPLSGALARGVPAAAATPGAHAAHIADHAAHGSGGAGHMVGHAGHNAAPHPAADASDRQAGHHGNPSGVGKMLDCCGLFCHAFRFVICSLISSATPDSSM